MTGSIGAGGAVGRAYAWAAFGQASSLIAALFLDAARGRLFDATEIGRYVAATWLLGLVLVVSEAGVGTVVVSARDLNERKTTALCDAALLMALMCCGILLAGAPLLALWTRTPSVGWVVAGMSPVVVLTGVGAVHRGLLLRRMDFRGAAIADVLAALAQLAVTVAGATVLDLGVWALVTGLVGGQLLKATLLRSMSAFRPKRPADWDDLQRVAQDAANITGSRLMFYGYMNADYFFLSRMSTMSALAIYYNAFRLATLPGLLVGNVIQQVTFSAFSASRSTEELRSRFIESLRLSATLAFPAALGLIVSAQFVIVTIYGPGWEPSVPVLRLLGVMGLTRSLQIIGPSVLLARGHSRVNLWISMAYVSTLLPAFWLAVPRGPISVAAAWVVVAAPLDMAVLVLGGRSAGVGLGPLLATIAPPAYRAITMAALVAGALALLAPPPGRPTAAAEMAAGLTAMAGGAVFFVAWTLWAEPDLRRRALAHMRSHN